jgi:quinohemoprotein ethanol dehydrogenase
VAQRPLSCIVAVPAIALGLVAGLAQVAPAADWPVYGGSAEELHYSPDAAITPANVGRLHPAWSVALDVPRANSEPIEVDGVVYVAAALSIVQAFDARSGKRLWRYDPEVGKVAGLKLRTSWGVRGMAWSDGLVFVGTQDGRLIALDAKSGQLAWSAQTTAGPDDGRYITGAPRVFGGKVIIGHGGADFAPVRGYVTCYDAKTGRQLWRFYTVPGNPADGFEDSAQAMAAKTWSGEWWKYGGGGTVWNAITYDAELNRLYLGTGNGAPWNWKLRNPKGGDALFLASIVALDADTGKYLWHYQQNPNEAWDYNAAADIQLATVTIGGQPRKVLMQAPKNGFFYVIDRLTGKLISAAPLGKVTWAERIDLKTGRPVERPGIRYEKGASVIWPGNLGLHNWPPMAHSPLTGLTYIPTIESGSRMTDAGIDAQSWKSIPGQFNSALGSTYGDGVDASASSALLAWDPLRQRQAWKVKTPVPWNGGVLVTAGGLVFQGQIDGRLNAYDAATGRKVWSYAVGNAVLGAPIAYSVAGRQYVAVVSAPPAGSLFQLDGANPYGWRYRDHPVRLLSFTLDGDARLPSSPLPGPVQPLVDRALVANPALATEGMILYYACSPCHGGSVKSLGSAPDLRASALVRAADGFANVVRQGSLVANGMPQYAELSDAQLLALRHYIQSEANAAAAPPEPR